MAFRVNDKNSTGEIASIGLMRGIASAMVCFFHLSYGNERLLPDSSLVKMTGKWGWAGIQIFFIISGFVIPYSMYVKNYAVSNMGTFLKKRIIRIEPPYIVSIILVLVLGYVSTLMPFYRGGPFHIDWLNVAGHIAYINVFTGARWLQDVYWTLAIEFQYYILIALAFGLVASKKQYLRILFFLLFTASLLLKPVLSSSFIFGFATYFILGILLFQYYCRISTDTEFWSLLFITISVSYYFEGPLLTGLSVVTVCMIALIKKVHPVFAFLGAISYSLYLIHIPVGGRIINITEAFIHSTHGKELMVFVAFAFCILAAYLYYLIIEKRFKILSSKIGYRKNTQPSVAGSI
ncbi:MAG: acyltransferase [Bacteroidota bacterium]